MNVGMLELTLQPQKTDPLAPLALYPKTRYVGLGLIIQMVLDSLACQMNLGIWFV